MTSKSVGRRATETKHQLEVGVVLVQPLGRRHADVRPRGVAQARAPQIQELDAQARVRPGTGEERDLVPERSQPISQAPDVRFEPAGERFDDRKASGRDDPDPQPPHASRRE